MDLLLFNKQRRLVDILRHDNVEKKPRTMRQGRSRREEERRRGREGQGAGRRRARLLIKKFYMHSPP